MFHTGNGQFLLEKELHDNSSKSGVKLTPHAYYAKGEIGIPLKEQYEAVRSDYRTFFVRQKSSPI
jgi:hypothetical protein